MGLHEVSPYYIDHTFYKSNMTFIMNPASWNRLPKHLQDLMDEVIIEVENEMPAFYGEFMTRDLQKAVAAGVEVIKFSPEDEKWFLDLAYEAGWAQQFKRYPELAPKFKELLVK